MPTVELPSGMRVKLPSQQQSQKKPQTAETKKAETKNKRLTLVQLTKAVKLKATKEFDELPHFKTMIFGKQNYSTSSSSSRRKLHVGKIPKEGRQVPDEVWAVVHHQNHIKFYDDSKELSVEDYKKAQFNYPFNCLHYGGINKRPPQLPCLIAYYFLAAGYIREFLEGGKPYLSIGGLENACVAIWKASRKYPPIKDPFAHQGLGAEQQAYLILEEIMNRGDFKRSTFDSVLMLAHKAVNALPNNDEHRRMKAWLDGIEFKLATGGHDLEEALAESTATNKKLAIEHEALERKYEDMKGEYEQLQLMTFSSGSYQTNQSELKEAREGLAGAKLEIGKMGKELAGVKLAMQRMGEELAKSKLEMVLFEGCHRD